MNRDHIKIVEFGMDDDTPATSTLADSGAIKNNESDNDREAGQQRVATGKAVGHIKIIEFDDDGTKPMPREPEKSKISVGPIKVGPIKIIEFDKEQDAPEFDSVAPKIKILEFD